MMPPGNALSFHFCKTGGVLTAVLMWHLQPVACSRGFTQQTCRFGNRGPDEDRSATKVTIQGLPWWSSGEGSALPTQGA